MSDTKWTPGPWRMEPQRCEGKIYIFEVRGAENEAQPMGAVTASCHFEREQSIAFDKIETAEANANLIAAAPDLYEALELALEYGVMTGGERIREKAKAALKNARGEHE